MKFLCVCSLCAVSNNDNRTGCSQGDFHFSFLASSGIFQFHMYWHWSLMTMGYQQQFEICSAWLTSSIAAHLWGYAIIHIIWIAITFAAAYGVQQITVSQRLQKSSIFTQSCSYLAGWALMLGCMHMCKWAAGWPWAGSGSWKWQTARQKRRWQQMVRPTYTSKISLCLSCLFSSRLMGNFM